GVEVLGGAVGVGAGHGAMDRATAGVLRRPERALARPAGALLPVRLPAAATDRAPGLGGVGALPGRRLLGHDHLVDQRDVDLDAEELGRELDVLAALAGRGDDLDLAHLASFTAGCLAALRTRTRAPRGPGMAPRMSSRPRSASTAWTVSRGTVVLTLPIRPAIRRPLNTRPGVARPPMEPGARCLRWVPCEAPRPRKPCRFITPAVPLPLVLPLTSTSSPASNVSAVTSWPRVYWSASSVRSSTRYRRGGAPALAEWPATRLGPPPGAGPPSRHCPARRTVGGA